MSNLGQFNLIVGDNNVGKTSVLEALLFDENTTKFIANYLYAFLNRGYRILNFDRLGDIDIIKIPANSFWQTFFKNLAKPLIFHVSPDLPFFTISFLLSNSLDEEEREEIRKTIFGVVLEYRRKNTSSGSGSGIGSGPIISEYWLKITSPHSGMIQMVPAYIPAFLENKEIYQLDTAFIPANLNYDDDLVRYFYKYFNEHKSTRRELEKRLRLIVPNLEELRIHRFYGDRDMIAFSLKDDDNLQPVTRYGDGTVRVVRLLMEIIVNQNQKLMVDEIGVGIHFTKLKEYWKTIIQLCSGYNVQLFATTHSLECQQAFIEALEDSEMQEYQKGARNITLLENKQGEVKAFTYTFDQFEYSLSIGVNTRGGQL